MDSGRSRVSPPACGGLYEQFRPALARFEDRSGAEPDDINRGRDARNLAHDQSPPGAARTVAPACTVYHPRNLYGRELLGACAAVSMESRGGAPIVLEVR